ncbi:MarR family winged helix-turn-helix transcriptional regulator [Nocardiopsis listeri]|uniref:MarR family winged helix-turn-helix transcriptional regulator n=1 Tax=Nocardiopsis listeri TaxID=53440 RepID=UPI000A51D7F2|nr:MarR family winged helix-turn-helix transcriptional regulator [Nocardiopsis listeri]
MGGSDRMDFAPGHTDGQDQTRADIPPELLAAPGYLVRRLYQTYTALWGSIVNSTLTGPQFAVMRAIQRTPGGDQGSLASMAALDRSTMADVARRLDRRQLIERRTSTSDTRRKLLYLTPEGERILSETASRAARLDELLLAELAPDQRARVVDDLLHLSDAWERLAEEGPSDEG